MTTRIVEVAPGELIIAANIRKDTKITKDFVASVKLHGVLVPILATETIAGLEVTDGQRRTLAAVDAGRATVPVIVTDAAATDAERIVEQIVVNEQREYLGNSEHVAAVKELALFGVSAAQIAKKTGVKREMVDTALAVAESPVATAALEQQVSLMDAAALVEFEDHPEIVESLLGDLAAGRGIQHAVARHRSELVEAAARAVVVAEILAAGHELLEQGPSWDDPRVQRPDRLYTSKELTTPLDEETMIAEAGADLRAFPRMKYGDWLEGGGRAPNTWSIGFAVTNWEAHGWFVRDLGGRSEPAKGPLTEDEKAGRRQARENTTLWVAATTVRLEWLAELVGRKTLPAGWEPLVVARMIDNQTHGTSEWRAAIAMLGLVESADTYSMRGVVQHHLETSPKTVLHTGLAVALGSIEGGYEFDRKGWQQGKTPAYLKLLASWGYELSELEQSIVTAAAL